LKTLEEPPQDSLLILIGTSAGSLLPTLRSRCLRVEFTPLSRSLIVEFLITKKSYDRDKAALAAALCMGSLGAAIAMDREVEDRRREWARRLSDLCRGDYAAALDLAEQLSANRDETLDFLRWAQSWYRDLLLHHLGEGDLINGDLLPELQRAGAAANLERILACAVEAAHAIPKIQRNLNRRMILEHLLFGAVTSE
jgi:DNA polymerase-3 subunit delta'